MFDSYLIVDWSAAATPRTGRDSIWCCLRGADGAVDTANPPTRQKAFEWIEDRLVAERAAGRRVLAGFDFPVGYSSGFAAALGLQGKPWQATWGLLAGLVEDGPANANNRFEVANLLNHRLSGRDFPFWGHPHGRAYDHLSPRRPDGYGALAEQRAADAGVPGTQPAWKLNGAGSVGGQALTGIPVLHRLRFASRIAGDVRVWPFETGWRAPGPEAKIVLAELYPTPLADPAPPGEPKDSGQVRGAARRLAERDFSGNLESLFDPPAGTDIETIHAVTAEEGWILGAPFDWVT